MTDVKTDVSIENIVASTVLAEKLDLTAVALALDGAEYEPEQFPGLVYRLKEERTAILLFRSGKANCTGAKTIESVQKTIRTVSKKLEEAGLAVIKEPKIVAERALMMAKEGKVVAVDGTVIELNPQTLCVHGDTPGAIELVKSIRELLEREGVPVKTMGLNS